MFGYSAGIAAAIIEASGVVTAFSYSSSQAQFAAYLAVHSVASLIVATLLLPLVPRAQRTRPLAAFALLFSISFFIPVIGVFGLLGTVLVGRTVPARTRLVSFDMHQAPTYDPRSGEITQVRSRGGMRVQLGNRAAPTETRLKALLAVQSLPARVANPMVREMLSDPSDDLRLVAYGILDSREKTINARIHAVNLRLAEEPDARTRGQLERQLAELYWELVYQGLVQGDLREHALAQVRAHLGAALELLPEDAALWSLRGRLAAQVGDYAEASQDFERARALGLPEGRVLPYLAEIAFRQHRYDEVERYARLLAASPQSARTAQVIRYWGAA